MNYTAKAVFQGENNCEDITITVLDGVNEVIDKSIDDLKEKIADFLHDRFDFDEGVDGSLTFHPEGEPSLKKWRIKGLVSEYLENEDDGSEFGEDVYEHSEVEETITL